VKASPRISAQAYLASIVESSDDAIFSQDCDGIITSWNRAAERLLAYGPPDAIGRPASMLFPEAVRALAAEALTRVRAGEAVVHFEAPLLGRHGDHVDASLTMSAIRGKDGLVLGISTIARDIRDRQPGELARVRLAAIVDSADDAIVSKDLNGIVTSWNPAAERLFGYTSEEMIGQSITKVIPINRLDEEEHVLSRIRAGLRVEHFETVRQRKNGELVDISLTVSPIRNDRGAIIGASKVARDVTEQKRLVEARRRAEALEEAARREVLEAENRRMQEANRLKSQFVANMSHELRTPLNSILGFAELIADERFGPLPARYRQFARTMLKSGRHLMRLINDVLDLAKVESGQIDFRPSNVDLIAIIAEVTSTVASLSGERKIRVGVDVDPAIGPLFVDPGRLKQVLYNYVSNAIKFSPEGGEVLIRARADGDAAFRIEVVDHGIGIKPEDQPRLFVDFQQLDDGTGKRFQGTGLGLAITKRIVEAQGGRVGVLSALGSGSTFFATLPRRAATQSADVSASGAGATKSVSVRSAS
jgi:PAS domain S-box-containing protein